MFLLTHEVSKINETSGCILRDDHKILTHCKTNNIPQ